MADSQPNLAQKRLDLIFRARLLAIAAATVGSGIVTGLLNPSGIPWVAAAAVFEIAVNQPYFVRLLKPRIEPRNVLRVHLFLDILVLTFVIHFLGGYRSGPIVASYLFIILYASMALGPREGAWSGAIGLFCFVVLLLLELFQVIEPAPPLMGAEHKITSIVALLIILLITFMLPSYMSSYVYRVVLKQERDLVRSLEKYKNLVEEMGEALVIMDREGVVIEANPRAGEMFGRGVDWLEGRSIAEVAAPESADDLAVLIQNVSTGEHVSGKNLRMLLPEGDEKIVSVNASPYSLDTGEDAIFIILRDVTAQCYLEEELRQYSEDLELRVERRTEELEESREIYLSMFEKAAVPLCWLDRSGVLQSGNRNYFELTGLGQAQSEGVLPVVDTLADERDRDRVLEYLELHRKGLEAPGRVELPIVSGGKRVCTEWFLRFEPLTDQFLLSMIDISERKRAERALRESEERYRSLVDTSPDAIVVTDREGNLRILNQQALAIMGVRDEMDLLGQSIYDFVVEEDRARARADSREALMEGGFKGKEYRLYQADGSTYSGEVSSAVIGGAKGKAEAFITVVRDITLRKRAERERQEYQKMLRLVMENIPQFVFWKDRESRYLGCNLNFAKVAGLSDPDEIVGKTDFDLAWSREEADFYRAKDREVMSNDQAEYHIIEPQHQADGKQAWLDTNKVPLHDGEGNVVGILGTYEDITQRKAAEEELEKYRLHLEEEIKLRTAELYESEAKYRMLFETSPDVIALVGLDGTILDYNVPVTSITGIPREEVVGKPFTELGLVKSNDFESYRDMLDKFVKGGSLPSPLELKFKKPDGEEIWLDIYTSVLENEDGPHAIQVISRDITERKAAEAALRESEERYRLLAENASDVIWTLDLATMDLTYVSSSCVNFRGFTADEVLAQKPEDIFTPESWEKARKLLAEELEIDGKPGADPERSRSIVLERWHKEGHTVWSEDRIKFIRDDEGKPAGLLAVTRDITEKKAAEDALQESERRYRLLAENVSDIIWTMDLAGRYTYISPSVERVRGVTVEEAMGNSIEDILTPESLRAVRKMIAEELAEESNPDRDLQRSRTVEVDEYKKDGTTFAGEITITFLRDGGGNAAGVLGVTRDVTERRRAARELRESEERYRLLAENASDVIWMSRVPDLQVIYVTPSILRQRGFTAEEFLKITPEGSVTPDSLQRSIEFLEQELLVDHEKGVDPNRSRTIELERYCKNGSTIWTEDTVSFVRDAGGNPVAIMGVTRDITKRKLAEWELERYKASLEEKVSARTAELTRANLDLQREIGERVRAEDALRRSEEHFRLLIENALDVISITRSDGTIAYESPSVEKVLGYSADEMVGKSAFDFVHPDDLPEVGRSFAEGLQRLGNTAAFEFRLRHKDGSWRMVEAIAKNMVDDPEVRGYIINSRDITERHKTEEALRDSESRLRSFLANSPDIICTLDRKGTVNYINRTIIPGITIDDVTGQNILDFLPPSYQVRGYRVMEDAFKGKATTGFQVVTIRDKWFECRIVPLPFADSIDAIMLIASDITGRRQMEEESRRLEAQLAEAERMAAVGEITAGVVHEMNSPLTAASFYAQALGRAGGLGEDEREKVRRIQDSADRIQTLLSRVMNFTTAQAGSFEPLSVNALVLQVIDALDHEFQARPGASLALDLAEDIPEVSASPEHIHDMLSNLVVNALQSFGGGPGRLRVSTRAAPGKAGSADEGPADGGEIGGPGVEIVIADNGPGIPEEHLDDIFKPFFTRRKKGEGSGLGLAIVKRVVDLHKGRIEVKSGPGKGTAFTVFLPLLPPEPVSARPARQPPSA